MRKQSDQEISGKYQIEVMVRMTEQEKKELLDELEKRMDEKVVTVENV